MSNNLLGAAPQPRFERYQEPGPAIIWHRSHKVKIFVFTFGVILLCGLIWTLLQPVVYRSSATVLMSAPTAVDAVISEANIQNVAIQRTILLGEDITNTVREELTGVFDTPLETSFLRDLLSVQPIADTNLIEMIAQGGNEEFLPALVDTWIDVYVGARAADIERRKNHTMQLVQDELAGMSVKIEESRDALALYREQNTIISPEREENEVLSRLDGLNTALNNAVEEEVRAVVYLDTLRESLGAGQIIVPESDRESLVNLEDELQQLRAEMIEMSKRYTREYMQIQPAMRAIPERISKLEEELALRLNQGQAEELSAARNASLAAQRAVQALEQKLDEHKEKVAKFSTVYATYEAMVEDLAELEQLNRESQSRLVQVEVLQVEKYPQVSVIERPGRAERIGPDYLLLLGSTLVAALGCGILGVWLYRFLGDEKQSDTFVTLTGAYAYSPENQDELSYTRRSEPALDVQATPLLRKNRTEDGPSQSEDG